MRESPSIIPGIDRDVYLVLDDFGRIGRAWRETDVEDTDYETVINDLLERQFANPVRVIGFNTAEGWSKDVSEDVAGAATTLRRSGPRAAGFPGAIRGAVHRQLSTFAAADRLLKDSHSWGSSVIWPAHVAYECGPAPLRICLEPCRPSKASAPPSGPDWVHDIKHDGFRPLARRDGKRTRLS